MKDMRKRATEPEGRKRMKTGGLRRQAWWILRNRRETTLENLLRTLADGTQKDAAGNLGKYLRALERAGILKRGTHRTPGAALTSNGHIRYALAIDCGPDAPVWRTSRNEVFAPSTGETYPIGAVHE